MSEVPLHMALDNIEFGTIVVDADGIVTFYSKSYERFLGIPRAQVLGRHVAEITELAQKLNLLESKLEYYMQGDLLRGLAGAMDGRTPGRRIL